MPNSKENFHALNSSGVSNVKLKTIVTCVTGINHYVYLLVRIHKNKGSLQSSAICSRDSTLHPTDLAT